MQRWLWACWSIFKNLPKQWTMVWRSTNLWQWVRKVYAYCILPKICMPPPPFQYYETKIFMRLSSNVVRCPNLPTLQNGRVIQRGNKPGDTATYVCNSGYELVGQSDRTCQTGGDWSGEAPTCKCLGEQYFPPLHKVIVHIKCFLL